MKTRLLFALPFLALPLLAETAKPTPPPDLNAPPADAERSSTGLLSKRLAEGTGSDRASETDYVKFHYTVWTSDGKLVDDISAPKVAVLPVAKMLPGLREAIETMSIGEHRRLWVPESLGARGRVPAGGRLVIDVDLVKIIHPPATPSDLATPPADAIKTRSGLAYKVLRAGTGTVHPKRSSTVRVHYSGWTTDGKMFDSSILRDTPAEFPLDKVIAGWTEGLQLMTEGERARFWIPSRLAYDNQPGKPMGLLVFDVELIAIE